MSDETTPSSPEPEPQHEGILGHIEHAAQEVEHAFEHDQATSDTSPTDASSQPASDETPTTDDAPHDETASEPVAADEPQDDKPLSKLDRRADQPDPAHVAAQLDNPAQQRDPLLQIAKNQFIAHQDYEAATTICPVCQAEFNPGTPLL